MRAQVLVGGELERHLELRWKGSGLLGHVGCKSDLTDSVRFGLN